MSKVGSSADSALAESFNATFKRETLQGHRAFTDERAAAWPRSGGCTATTPSAATPGSDNDPDRRREQHPNHTSHAIPGRINPVSKIRGRPQRRAFALAGGAASFCLPSDGRWWRWQRGLSGGPQVQLRPRSASPRALSSQASAPRLHFGWPERQRSGRPNRSRRPPCPPQHPCSQTVSQLDRREPQPNVRVTPCWW